MTSVLDPRGVVRIHWDQVTIGPDGSAGFLGEVATPSGMVRMIVVLSALPRVWMTASGEPPRSVRAAILSPGQARRAGLL